MVERKDYIYLIEDLLSEIEYDVRTGIDDIMGSSLMKSDEKEELISPFRDINSKIEKIRSNVKEIDGTIQYIYKFLFDITKL